RRSSDLANVDVTVVRITNKAVSAALQLAVEFIEHEVTQQWRKRSSLRSSFHAGADQSVLHHPGIEQCPDELQQPLVLDALGDLAHQFVVIDSIKELFQIEIDHPSVTLRDVLLRLSHSVMRRSTRSKPVAVLGERRVPSLLQHLHHRLLDEAIQRGGDAKLSHPSIRLRDFHPPHRFRFVGPVQQLLPNGRPVLLQIVAELIDRHPVDARATFVALHLPQCFLQVCSFTYLLQDACWLGVRAHSPPRAIRCLPAPPAGLHPSAPMRSPVSTGYSAACRFRDSCPTCLSSRSGLQPSFPVRPICCLHLSATECLTSLADDMT